MRNFRGFTLIELLVVISIIVLLIGILFPFIGSIRDNSRLTLCANNQRQIGVGFVAYSGEYKDAVTYATMINGQSISALGTYTFDELLAKYTGHEGLSPKIMKTTYVPLELSNPLFICPDDDQSDRGPGSDHKAPRSYSMLQGKQQPGKSLADGMGVFYGRRSGKMYEPANIRFGSPDIPDPSQAGMMTDASFTTSNASGNHQGDYYAAQLESASSQVPGGRLSYYQFKATKGHVFGGEYVRNYLLADGHVTNMTPLQSSGGNHLKEESEIDQILKTPEGIWTRTTRDSRANK